MVYKMLKVGKLDSELLKEIVFDKITFRRDEVITRPGIGEDCAVMDFGDYECVLSTDPITASIEDIGREAVHISCNDIASNGVEPVGLLLAVLLPEGTTEEQIANMMDQAGKASEELGVEIIGGHTEITRAVNKPVMISTAIGRGPKGGSQDGKDMKPGDLLIVTKNVGLEGTGLIATERDMTGILTEEERAEAVAMLDDVSVVKEGIIAGRIGTHGMHDVTEGGILGAVWEMCSVSGLGATVTKEAIPVADVTVKLADAFGLDWMRLISSGCMLIVMEEEKWPALEKELADAGIGSACIGKVEEKERGVRFADGSPIEPPEADEIYKAVD